MTRSSGSGRRSFDLDDPHTLVTLVEQGDAWSCGDLKGVLTNLGAKGMVPPRRRRRRAERRGRAIVELERDLGARRLAKRARRNSGARRIARVIGSLGRGLRQLGVAHGVPVHGSLQSVLRVRVALCPAAGARDGRLAVGSLAAGLRADAGRLAYFCRGRHRGRAEAAGCRRGGAPGPFFSQTCSRLSDKAGSRR